MPVAIQPPVQVDIAPDRVALSGNPRSAALRLDLFADALTVIALGRHDYLGRRQLCNQLGSCRAVVDVASCLVKEIKMLTAILHGKAGCIDIGGRSISWRSLFRKREDLLTSVLFGRMPYLSSRTHDAFLSALLGQELAGGLGQLRDIQFWPRLGEAEGRRYVEPDVLIEYLSHRLLIEVKPPFGGIQTLGQWRAEVRALHRQGYEPKNIILLALGRNQSEWQGLANKLEHEFSATALRVVCLEWPELLRRLNLIRDLADIRDERIFQDWFEAFRLFGMVKDTAPFSDLLALCEASQDLSSHFEFIRCWTITETIPTQTPSASTYDWGSLLPLARTLEKE